MSTADLIEQIVHDTLFEIRNIADETKKVVYNLAGAATNKVLTLVSEHTDNRTLKFPDKDGTLATVEGVRETLISSVIDYSTHELVRRVLPASETLVINNPILGKMVYLEVEPEGFDLSMPAYVKVLSGRFRSNTVNYIYLHCVDASTPVYLATIAQQIA